LERSVAFQPEETIMKISPLALATAFALSSTVALAQAGGAAGTGSRDWRNRISDIRNGVSRHRDAWNDHGNVWNDHRKHGRQCQHQ
jgi:hypothetical protein